MAISDADGNFLAIDVGEYGRNSDGRVFREGSIGQAIIQKTLDLLQPSCLQGENNKPPFPYYFVVDEAFPLLENLMNPYPRRQLNNTKRIYNYRISRGRKSIECAFGMLATKFRILNTPISRKTEKIDTMIKALCVLHNFIRLHDGVFTLPSEIFNNDDEDGNHFEDEFQQNNQQLNRTRPTNTAIELRDRLRSYFIQPYAALHWQNKYITGTV
ncbi:uncharacterized protein LOC132932501 [Metopolophium dirhodum]|uniref:uncharacterized protein LOC132932501 n=1 Tax=Metopolophium dirhodum TaxID=44670 RepID=UPI00298FBC7D|nr:uncharacterized protein LOC132932501 [Metopolophium dirhodum]